MRTTHLLLVTLLALMMLLVRFTDAQNTTTLQEWSVSVTAFSDSCSAKVEEYLAYEFTGTVFKAVRTIHNDQRYRIHNVAVSSDTTSVQIVKNVAEGLNHNVEWTWPNATSALTFVFSYSLEKFVHYDDDNNTFEFTLAQSSNINAISDFSLEVNLGWAVSEDIIYSVPASGNITETLTDTILEYRPVNFTTASLPWSLYVTYPAPTTGPLRECTSKLAYVKNDIITVVLIIVFLACVAGVVAFITFFGVLQAKPFIQKMMAPKKIPGETPLLETNSMMASPELSTTFTGISTSSSASPQV